ncbi:MAG: hypothetical protein P4L73_17720 [Caulobacteraceae bacterium]|nr:hypothetical protein [Caulobacteraceae bacterium]
MKISLQRRLIAGAAGLALAALHAQALAQTQTQADSQAMPAMSAPMAMDGAFGPYPMAREASGTSWQPDATPQSGVMLMTNGWTLMGAALIDGVYDRQGGAEGGDKSFAAGMVMGMAQRTWGPGVVSLRAMFSPDPFMGKDGYPLLLATGETADGRTPLVDRQHPHNLVMELAASYSLPLGAHDSVFVYGGPAGEPAFGPPAFMHRASGEDIPEAPISHHWLDSTHITYGVATAGYVHDKWKVEASVFNGREPDQQRFAIETGAMDSAAARVSYNPTAHWSFQASWARLNHPEQLDPTSNQNRLSASAIYSRPIGAEGSWSTTLAYGWKQLRPGPALDAWLLESEIAPDRRWTLFARAERVEENELLTPGLHTVGKLSVGAIHDWSIAPYTRFGLGGLVSAYALPRALVPEYGKPTSGMLFVRLKIG